MKILWTVNIIFPYPAHAMEIKTTPYGGWLLGLFNKIRNYPNIELCIITSYKGKKLKTFKEDNVIYYLIPCNNPKKKTARLINYCRKVYYEFNPDLIHIHGTEYIYGKIFQEISNNSKSVVSLQGLTSISSNFYMANLKISDIKRNFTIRNFIKGDIIKEQKNFEKSGKNEKDIIKNATAIIGRTTWDYANSTEFEKGKKYYICNESLRDDFYDKVWDINKIEKHSIYISQGGYSIKGLHIMLEALNILKNKYPDVKLYIAGKNIFQYNSIMDYIKYSNYQKIILKIIKKYNLKRYMEFTGSLSADQVAERLSKCNVFVQASSIENSSNALGEAMLIGMPCVASYVGGTPDMINDKDEGFLYPFGDYGLLAHYISKVFDNDEIALNLGKQAQKHAKKTHDRDNNAETMIKIYNDIINKKE